MFKIQCCENRFLRPAPVNTRHLGDVFALEEALELGWVLSQTRQGCHQPTISQTYQSF
jgi:hypothetical protein